MIDPVLGVGKLAGAAIRPLAKLARSQIGRRGASTIATANPASIEKEVAEAIGVLRQRGETSRGTAWAYIKSHLSDRPAIFEEPEAQLWLSHEDVPDLLGRAALTLISGKDVAPFEDEAKRLYVAVTEDADWYGGILFDYSVAFIALSIHARITPEARLLLAVAAEQQSDILDIKQQVAASANAIETLAEAAAPPVDIIDRFIHDEVALRSAFRSIVDPNALQQIVALGERVLSGNLKGATPPAQFLLFRFVSASLARAKDFDEAERWLARAAALFHDPLAPDRARIALLRGDAQKAIELLDGHDDPLSNSLRLDALKDRDGAAEAINYFERYCDADRLTGHFLSSLAHWFAEERSVAQGEALLASATEDQLRDNRLLRYTRLRFRMALFSPVDQQLSVIQDPGLLPPPRTLSDDLDAQRCKAFALEDADALLSDLTGQSAPIFRSVAERTQRYLGLISHDLATADAARTALVNDLADPDRRVIFVPLAMIFGVDFDTKALEAQLEQTARLRGLNNMELRAAFDLAIHSDDIDRIVDFAETNCVQLIETVGSRQAIGVPAEALARAGRVIEARALAENASNFLSAPDRRFIDDIVTDVAGEATPDLHLARFAATGNEQDLTLAVRSMIDAHDARLPDEAYRLWQMRHRTADAIVAANAFAWAGRERDLQRFLTELGDVALGDLSLATHLAWTRYREGDLAGAEELTGKLRADHPDDSSLRQLRINIALEAGEWHGLGDLYRQDLDRAAQRTVKQLLQSAAMASAVDNPDGKPLLHAAAARAGDDPVIYAAAFELALERGEDLEDAPLEWLNRAIALSGADGPLQSRPLTDLIAMRDAMATRHSDFNRMLLSGAVTVAMAAKPLGTTLTAMLLDHAALNAARVDARTRFHLPIFAGNRLPTSLVGAKRVAFEPTAFLTLHMLGLLEPALAAFDTIVLPPGSLPAVFDDLVSGERGQPSRAVRAAEVLRLRAAGRFVIVDNHDPVTDEVDQLFAIAEERDGRLVHIPPLTVAGTLAQEIRDPAPFAARLASVAGILAALEARGEIGMAEAERARRFPSVRSAWDDEPPVDLAQPLVLDAVALHYLIDATLIEPLIALETPLIVSQQAISYSEAEIAERGRIDAYQADIERLRAILTAALRDGRAEVGPSLRDRGARGDLADVVTQQDSDMEASSEAEPPESSVVTGGRSADGSSLAAARENDSDRDSTDGDDAAEDDSDEADGTDPLSAILLDSAGVDWLVADDRFVNQHGQFVDGKGWSRGVATSLDVIDHLLETGAIDHVRRAAAIQKLRATGLGLIPVTTEEIVAAATMGDWQHGPPRALRAIRDSLLLPFLRRSILLPLETHWVQQLSAGIALAIKEIFRTLGPVSAARAADFLIHTLPDLRALAAENGTPDARLWADAFTVGTLASLAIPLGVGDERIEAYHRWFAETPHALLKGRFADLRGDVLDRLEEVLLTYKSRLEVPEGLNPPSDEQVARWILGQIAAPLRIDLMKIEAVRQAVGRSRILRFDGFDVAQSDIVKFLTDVAHERPARLEDVLGSLVADKGTLHPDGSTTVERGDRITRFSQAGLHSPERAMRERVVSDFLADNMIAPSREAHWRAMAADGPFSAEDFHALSADLLTSPDRFVRHMSQHLADDGFEVPQLADMPEAYFLGLAEGASDDRPLPEIIASLTAKRRDSLHPRTAALSSAPLAVAPDFKLADITGPLNPDDAAEFASALIDAGDPFSMVAAFELVCAHLGDPACRALGDRIIDGLWGADGMAADLAEDFCSAAIITTAVSAQEGSLRGWTLPGRRLAIFAHAGHICRVFRNFDMPRPSFFEEIRGAYASELRIVDMHDRSAARGWSLNLLIPSTIEAYMVARIDAVLDTIDDIDRPEPWIATLSARVDRFGGPTALSLLVPGPLDEFCEIGGRKSPMRSEDVADMISRLEDAPSTATANLLFSVAIIFKAPEGNLSALTQAILDQAHAAEDELREDYYRSMLQLAVSWILPDLAEGTARLIPHSDMVASALVAEALAISAAHPDAITQRIALREHIMAQAQTVESGGKAAEFVRTVGRLANIDPNLATFLEPARICAALAI
jgi:hypothetical protein